MIQTKRKILIIEDDSDTTKLLKDTLEDNSFACLTATTAAEGLQLIDAFRPDLILLDLMLPKMSGFGFMREIKNRASLRQIPVVVLTALADEEIVNESLNLGAASYLTKACKTDELLSVVKEYSSGLS